MFAGLACSCGTAEDGDAFVRVENGRFVLDGKPCYFLGTNFWYGPILGSKGPGGDRERLARELDTLAACGVTNLRVLVGADGGGGVPSKSNRRSSTPPASTTTSCSTVWTTSSPSWDGAA